MKIYYGPNPPLLLFCTEMENTCEDLERKTCVLVCKIYPSSSTKVMCCNPTFMANIANYNAGKRPLPTGHSSNYNCLPRPDSNTLTVLLCGINCRKAVTASLGVRHRLRSEGNVCPETLRHCYRFRRISAEKS